MLSNRGIPSGIITTINKNHLQSFTRKISFFNFLAFKDIGIIIERNNFRNTNTFDTRRNITYLIKSLPPYIKKRVAN